MGQHDSYPEATLVKSLFFIGCIVGIASIRDALFLARRSISSNDRDCTTVCLVKISNLLVVFITRSELSYPSKSL